MKVKTDVDESGPARERQHDGVFVCLGPVGWRFPGGSSPHVPPRNGPQVCECTCACTCVGARGCGRQFALCEDRRSNRPTHPSLFEAVGADLRDFWRYHNQFAIACKLWLAKTNVNVDNSSTCA